jgi:hypothetical protein
MSFKSTKWANIDDDNDNGNIDMDIYETTSVNDIKKHIAYNKKVKINQIVLFKDDCTQLERVGYRFVENGIYIYKILEKVDDIPQGATMSMAPPPNPLFVSTEAVNSPSSPPPPPSSPQPTFYSPSGATQVRPEVDEIDTRGIKPQTGEPQTPLSSGTKINFGSSPSFSPKKSGKKYPKKFEKKSGKKSPNKSKKKSGKKSPKKSPKPLKKSPRKSLCKQRLAEKIAINMKEMNEEGKYKSRAQAIAVAYSEVQKMYPHCKRYLKKK